MTEVLNLFPSRAAIGKWRDPVSGKDIPVNMTPEFERALAVLFRRVGGAVAPTTDDFLVDLALQPAPAGESVAAARVAELEREVMLLRTQLAAYGSLVQRLDALERTSPQSDRAITAQLNRRMLDAEISAIPQSPSLAYVNWARPGAIGSSTPNSGAFTTISATGIFTSTLATGTAPFTVASTTKVANLNVDLLDGGDWAAPAAIGSTTPNSILCTTISASTSVESKNTGGTILSTSNSANVNARNFALGQLTAFGRFDLKISAALGGDATAGASILSGTATGVTVAGAFGCNTKAAQTAFASGGAVAATGATNAAPFGYTTAAQADAIVTLVNNIRSALVANGIMS